MCFTGNCPHERFNHATGDTRCVRGSQACPETTWTCCQDDFILDRELEVYCPICGENYLGETNAEEEN